MLSEACDVELGRVACHSSALSMLSVEVEVDMVELASKLSHAATDLVLAAYWIVIVRHCESEMSGMLFAAVHETE